jgi:hypothetical protein
MSLSVLVSIFKSSFHGILLKPIFLAHFQIDFAFLKAHFFCTDFTTNLKLVSPTTGTNLCPLPSQCFQGSLGAAQFCGNANGM